MLPSLALIASLAASASAPVGVTASTLPLCTRIPLPAVQPPVCVPVTVHTPHATLHLAVASTEPQRERGLMNVRAVPPDQGMLFAFADGDQLRGFWMKDTITALDMVFVAGDGTITDIAANVPATLPNTPDAKVARREGVARYVIELGAGQAAALGLRVGTVLTIPAVEAR